MNVANKQDLKTLLKPILKEMVRDCVREAIFETGVLSNIIKEVASGLKSSMIIENVNISTKKEVKKPVEIDPELEKRAKHARQELINEQKEKAQKMMKATGMEKMFSNIPVQADSVQSFEEPKKEYFKEIKNEDLTLEEKQELLEEQTRVKEEEKAASKHGAPKGGYALRGIDPHDPGVSVKGIMEMFGIKRISKL